MKKYSVIVRQWKSSLAVRIPAAIARAAQISVGQPVTISLEDAAMVVRRADAPQPSLDQKLAVFDSTKHGGEVIATVPVGTEIL